MDVSVVIPSGTTEDLLTVESLPDDVDEVVVSTVDGPSRARNDGIERATNDLLVLLDDDLRFEESWFHDLVERTRRAPDVVFAAEGTGLLEAVSWPEGFASGMTRVMTMHRHVWADVGGFRRPGQVASDPDYGSDTDFLMSAYELGYEVRGLAHEWEHHDEPDEYTLLQNARWLLWLARRHPRLVGPRLPALLYRKLTG